MKVRGDPVARAQEPLLDEHSLEAVHEVTFRIPGKIGATVWDSAIC